MGLRHLLLAMTTALLLFGLPACGGTSSGYLKVDSPLLPFEAPERDELLESLDIEDEIDADDEAEDTGAAADDTADTATTPAQPEQP